jgi:hypothetical protein
MQLRARVVFFGGEYLVDPDAAAEALRAAGYEVHRLPAGHPPLDHRLDDFIEAITDGPPGPAPNDLPPDPAPNDLPPDVDKACTEMMQRVQDLVGAFEGSCEECGPIEAGYVPLVEIFCGWTPPPPAVVLPFRPRESTAPAHAKKPNTDGQVLEFGADNYSHLSGIDAKQMPAWFHLQDDGDDEPEQEARQSWEAEDVAQMIEEEMEDVIEKAGIDLDLGKHSTTTRKARALICALQAEGMLRDPRSDSEKE